MFYTLAMAHAGLKGLWLMGPLFSAAASALFFVSFFIPGNWGGLYFIVLLAVCITLPFSIYFSYRAGFGSECTLVTATYGVMSFQILFGGGVAMDALWVAGLNQHKWWAFGAVECIFFASLLVSMWMEFRRCTVGETGLIGKGNWRREIEKYVDYKKNSIDPYVSTPERVRDESPLPKNAMVISSIGITGIPLVFELYGGGRANAIYWAAPAYVGLWVYLNMKTIGPGLMRLLLVRKLEKEKGLRFVNAEFEEIQTLRRTFFMARFLMRDYSVVPDFVAQIKSTRKNKIKKR